MTFVPMSRVDGCEVGLEHDNLYTLDPDTGLRRYRVSGIKMRGKTDKTVEFILRRPVTDIEEKDIDANIGGERELRDIRSEAIYFFEFFDEETQEWVKTLDPDAVLGGRSEWR